MFDNDDVKRLLSEFLFSNPSMNSDTVNGIIKELGGLLKKVKQKRITPISQMSWSMQPVGCDKLRLHYEGALSSGLVTEHITTVYLEKETIICWLKSMVIQ